MISFIFLRKVKLLEAKIGKAKPIEEIIYKIGSLEKFNKNGLAKN
jgi:hypothetical protein